MINTYRPPVIKPLPGNVEPFLEYLDYLIPDPEDRFKVMRWCATLIARPQIRMRYSMLLISETQGVGKTTLSDAILKPLVGPWNVSSPNEQQVVDAAFNSWIAHKRLACVNEIYSGSSRKAYDRLKQVTADSEMEVHRKFMEPYDIECYLHVVACSNSIQALHLDDTDRRFLVPGIAETLKPKAWWNTFYAYLNGGGLAAVAAWAEAFVMKHGPVETGDRAPDTTKKQEVIAQSRTEGAQLAYDLARAVASRTATVKNANGEQEPVGDALFAMDEVRVWVAGMRGMSVSDRRLESQLTLRKAMVAGGLLRPARKDGSDGRITIMGKNVEVLANFQIEAGAVWKTKDGKDGLWKHLKKPDLIVPFPTDLQERF